MPPIGSAASGTLASGQIGTAQTSPPTAIARGVGRAVAAVGAVTTSATTGAAGGAASASGSNDVNAAFAPTGSAHGSLPGFAGGPLGTVSTSAPMGAIVILITHRLATSIVDPFYDDDVTAIVSDAAVTTLVVPSLADFRTGILAA
jgi:hypothetical protein